MVTNTAASAASTSGAAAAAAAAQNPASSSTEAPSAAQREQQQHVDDEDDDDDDEDDDDQDFGDWVDDDDEGDEDGQQVAGGKDSASAGQVFADADAPSVRGPKTPTHALFPDAPGAPLKLFSRPEAALQHAKEQGCDFRAVVRAKGLDALQVIRLLNHLRRAASKGAPLTPQQITALSGSESFLNDDAELVPVPGFEMDGLLQIDFDDNEDVPESTPTASGQTASSSASAGARAASTPSSRSELESELIALRLAFDDLRERYAASIGLTAADRAAAAGAEEGASGSASSTAAKGKAKLSPFAGVSKTHAPLSENDRLDDQHYFTSYASNDIHQTMISDSVRTLSYAKFILSPANAHLFRGKTVMDVGCGSGILSLFAARAGAANVLAIDASDIADRTVQNIQENGFGHVIRVFKGKIEDLGPQLAPYEGKVDVIVSEWMGYFLIYEAMLPSVLHARDRYLRKPSQVNADGTSSDGGILAPSHTRMTLAGVEDAELLHERIHFWEDVYGFKMTAMTKGLTDDAYTEGLKKEALITDTANIFDLPLMTMSTKQPEFVSAFTLKATRKGTIHAFLSWFDTWFLPAPLSQTGFLPPSGKRDLEGGEILEGLPPCETREPVRADVPGLAEKLRGNDVVSSSDSQEAAPAGPGEVVSFTTGPEGKETHWKQTAFLLKDPIEVEQGSIISGRINVSQSATHSRELEVELHYLVQDPADIADADGNGDGQQRPKAKRVQTSIAQCFAVR
ncbi:hypothetical protein OC844_006084 [Tilletia horrida]|nr:hypothetical protein OC844_006084 [Tilletia horrida]